MPGTRVGFKRAGIDCGGSSVNGLICYYYLFLQTAEKVLVLEIYYSFSSYLNSVLHERILLNLRAYEITGECNNINRDFVAGRTVGARLRSELWLTMNYQGYLRVPF